MGLESDLRFVVSSWVSTLRGIYPNQYALDYFPRAIGDVTAHIQRANTLIAYLENEPDEIVSYLVFLRRRDICIAHFAYTKDGARRQGHVSSLLALANPEGLPWVFTRPARNENAMRHFVSRAIYDEILWQET